MRERNATATWPRRHATAPRALACVLLVLAGGVVALAPAGAARAALGATAGPLEWHAPIDPDLRASDVKMAALACASASTCAAVDRDGTLWGHAGSLASPWWPSDVDAPIGLVAVACPVAGRCTALDRDGSVVTASVTASGVTASSVQPVDDAGQPTGIACAGTALCVVVDASGLVFASTDPFAGPTATWNATDADPGATLTAVACPTAARCVAVDTAGDVVTSGDPGSAAARWTVGTVDPGRSLLSIACGTVDLCVAGDDAGDVVVSTTPQRATASSWRVEQTATHSAIGALTCVGARLCEAADAGDRLLGATTPAAPVRWRQVTLSVGSPLVGVSCWSTARCVALDRDGDLLTSTRPTMAGSWRRASLGDPTIRSLSCPSTGLCVGVDASRGLVTSTAPASAAWSRSSVGHGGAFGSVDCPAPTLCVAVDANGNVWTSRSPTRGRSSWSSANVDPAYPLLDVSCAPRATVCAAIDPVSVYTSTDPTGGVTRWTGALLDGQLAGLLTGISCPSTSLCVAVDDQGQVVTTTQPTRGTAARWRVTSVAPGTALDAVACPSTTRCVATDAAGDVLVTDQPTGGPSAWSRTAVDPGAALVTLSCPSTTWCLAADAGGDAFSSVSPGSALATWSPSEVTGVPSLDAVACASAALCVAGGADGALEAATPTVGPATAGGAARPGTEATAAMQLGINSLLLYDCEPTTEWDQWATNQVDAFKALGANAVALAFPFYTDSSTSNAFAARTDCGAGSAYLTPPPDLVAQVVDIAHAAGLTVLLRPYLDQTDLAAANPFAWKGNIDPTDPRLWFENYLAALTPYLEMAQAHGVEHFAISTELESMANAPYWTATIAAARRLYAGDLVFCSSWLDNGDEAPWSGTSEAIDMYRGVPHVTNTATPLELEAGWDKALLTYDPVADLRNVTADEVGIPAQDNTYTHPNGASFPLASYPFDQAVQANWYSMACDFAKAHAMAGLYFWGSAINLDGGNLLSAPSPSLSSDVQPLTQAAIQRCFEG